MSFDNYSLEGRVAVVTGGGTGMGRAIALEFAKAGADVVVASRRLSVLEKVSEEVRALGKRSLAIPTDVTEKSQVDDLVEQVTDELGAIDVLVNNVGGSGGRQITGHTILTHSEEDWDAYINVNLKSSFLCSQAVSKGMMARKKGNIINMSSISAVRVHPVPYAYCVAKAGLIMLTKTLAHELADYGVRANCISPGTISGTEMSERWSHDPGIVARLEKTIPLHRVGEPEDIASVALFLASDASRFITGESILVDGGQMTL